MREYNSSLACYITGLIKQKPACGYSYDYQAYILESFDRFCIEKNHTTGTITRDMVMQWAIQRPTEGKNHAYPLAEQKDTRGRDTEEILRQNGPAPSCDSHPFREAECAAPGNTPLGQSEPLASNLNQLAYRFDHRFRPIIAAAGTLRSPNPCRETG